MGRTLPTSTVLIQQEEAAFSRFRRALRRADQLALDDLFTSARQHLAAAQYAAHALPFEVFLLSMLLEEHKEVIRLREGHELLRQQLEQLLARQNTDR
jgi:predicted acylesterase/phospholipase RssA